MHFLLEAAHAYALLAPAASRSMIARARGLAKANKFEVHSSLRQKFCGNCSQIFVPGANCRVRIEPWRKRRRRPPANGGAGKADTADASSRRRGRPSSTARPNPATDGKKEVWASKQRQGAALPAAAPLRRRLKRLCHACAVCGHVQRAKVDATRKASQRQDSSQGRKADSAEEARNAKQAMKRARDGKAKGKGKDHPGGPASPSAPVQCLAAAVATAVSPAVSAPLSTTADPATAAAAVTAAPAGASVAADAGASVAAQATEQTARSIPDGRAGRASLSDVVDRRADLRKALAPAQSAVGKAPIISVPTANASVVAGRRANLRNLLAPTPDVSSAPAVAVLRVPPVPEEEQGGGKRSKRRRGSDRMGMALAGSSTGDDFML